MATMAARLVDAASDLLHSGVDSAAFRRRAVSTAYYAVFHAVAKLCADRLTFPTPRTDADYERVYRALEHGPMKQAFAQPRLKENELLRKIGVGVTRLQAERFKADYLPPIPDLFPLEDAQELVALAESLVAEIERIDIHSSECRILSANLLFKDRRQ
jgi:uncharacterized protein (UPF0332 family)